MVTAEEHSIIGGLGSAVAEVLVENLPYPWREWGQDSFGSRVPLKNFLKNTGLLRHIASGRAAGRNKYHRINPPS